MWLMSSRWNITYDGISRISHFTFFWKAQNRKEFAAVLNEGLLIQSKWIRADRSLSETEVAPAIPKHCRPAVGTSETLPRSRGKCCNFSLLHVWMCNSF